jgi:hypothetical protein
MYFKKQQPRSRSLFWTSRKRNCNNCGFLNNQTYKEIGLFSWKMIHKNGKNTCSHHYMIKQNSVTLFGAGILGTMFVGLICSVAVQYAPINVSAQTTNLKDVAG